MSEVKLLVRDASRSIAGTIHGSSADRLVAALTAEPETIEELDQAVRRFERRDHASCFSCFHEGDDDEPWDAGVVIIDLAARLVALDSTWSCCGLDGYAEYH